MSPASCDVSSLFRKLEVVGSRFASEHNSVEPVMVFEFEKQRQTEAIAIEPQKTIKVVSRSRDPKRCHMRAHSRHQQEHGLNLAVSRRE